MGPLPTTWNINGPDAGSVQSGAAGVSFTTIGNMQGGSGADAFALSATGSLTGSLDGAAGNDTLQGSRITDVTLTGSGASGFAGTTAAVTGGFAGIDVVQRAQARARSPAKTWRARGAWMATPTYSDGTGTLAITGFGTLQGGTAVDTFTVTAPSAFTLKGGTGDDVFDLGAVLTGALDGEADSDTLGGSQITDVTLTAPGRAALPVATAAVTGGFAGIDIVTGTGAGTLTGEDTASTWSLDGTPTSAMARGPWQSAGLGRCRAARPWTRSR